MEISSSNRRSFNRTWKRLGPLLELIVASTSTTSSTLSSTSTVRELYSISDVGCDHGILSMSLACMAHASSLSSQQQEQQLSNNNDSNIDGTETNTKNSNNNDNNINYYFFNRVYGTDISSKALDNGALQTLKKIMNAITWSSSSTEHYYINNNNNSSKNYNNTELLPIEFRISNGLEALHIGEADAIVLAGMGVESMMEILFLDDDDGRRRRKNKNHDGIPPPVDRVQTNYIYLQPTNSRPQHMMKLYDRIQRTGEWILRNESIAYSSGRWYIDSFFERRQQQQNQQSNTDNDDNDRNSRFRYPGHFLEKQDSTKNDNNDNVYESYIQHHLQWLKDDYERTSKYVIEDEDRRWIEYITSNKKT